MAPRRAGGAAARVAADLARLDRVRRGARGDRTRARQQLSDPPGAVTLAFARDVDPGSAKMIVTGPDGSNVTIGALIVEGTNLTTQLREGLPAGPTPCTTASRDPTASRRVGRSSSPTAQAASAPPGRAVVGRRPRTEVAERRRPERCRPPDPQRRPRDPGHRDHQPGQRHRPGPAAVGAAGLGARIAGTDHGEPLQPRPRGHRDRSERHRHSRRPGRWKLDPLRRRGGPGGGGAGRSWARSVAQPQTSARASRVGDALRSGRIGRSRRVVRPALGVETAEEF